MIHRENTNILPLILYFCLRNSSFYQSIDTCVCKLWTCLQYSYTLSSRALGLSYRPSVRESKGIFDVPTMRGRHSRPKVSCIQALITISRMKEFALQSTLLNLKQCSWPTSFYSSGSNHKF